MIKIPTNEKKWIKSNESDLLGNIWITKNITFDTNGYLRLSFAPKAVITEATTDFDNVADIIYNEDYTYFVATWDSAWSVANSPFLTTPTKIATAGVPATDIQTGLAYIGALLVVTQDTDVDYYDTSTNTWTDTSITLTASGQHPPVFIPSTVPTSVAIADVYTVKLYAKPLAALPTLVTTLTIDSNYQITSMVYFNQYLYIGTRNVMGGNALMYVWNCTGTAAQQAYEVDSNIIFSLCVHNNTVYSLIGSGALMAFSGSGFDFVDAFPMFYTDTYLTDYSNISLYKGIMKSTGDYLYILFSNQENQRNSLTYQPDGLWCYDENIGLYHRYSASNSVVSVNTIDTTAVNITTNQITVTSAPFTGTEIYYEANGGTAIGGLTDHTKYFAIKVDATHIKLATSNANATTGTAIDLTGTGNAFQTIIFFPKTDYGAFYTARPTCTEVIKIPSSFRQYGTDVLFSTEVYRRDNTGDYGTLCSVSTGVESRGYFITPKIFSDNITDQFKKLTLKFSPFTSELDKIIIKYRTWDDMKDIIDLNDWGITWASSTTFTSTSTKWADASIGDEIEVLRGAGGGLLAHITNISEAGGTYTITIDETFNDYTSGDLGKAVFRNWTKFKTIEYGDSDAEQYYFEGDLGVEGKFLQLKIELRGIQVRIEELLVDNKYRLPSSDK